MKTENEILKKASHLYSRQTEQGWASLQKKMVMPGKKNQWDSGRNILWGFPIRVAVVLLFLAGMGWGLATWVNSRPTIVHTLWNQQQVKLPDGSVVYLNGNSRIEFPKRFAQKNRKVKLSGEAFFQVRKMTGKPFVVEVAGGRVIVHGTAFNVMAQGKDHRVEVLVRSGVVGLSADRTGAPEVILHAGEFGVFRQGKVAKAMPPPANYLAWRTKILRFDNEKLADAIMLINRAYAKNLVLAEDSLGGLRLTSTYDHAGFETVLRSVCLTFHLKYRKAGDKIILSPEK